MALGVLMITFITLSVISGLSIAFLFLTKGPRLKQVLFYVISLLGMLIAFVNATSFPVNNISGQFVSWGIGFLSIIAICIHLLGKSPKSALYAQILASAGVALGIFNLFF